MIHHHSNGEPTPVSTDIPTPERTPHTQTLAEVSGPKNLTPRAMRTIDIGESIQGCLLGCAVGDSRGLFFEKISPQRRKVLYGEITENSRTMWRGMVSDDTEHTAMVAQALIESRGNVDAFRNCFARRLSKWLAFFPAGAGKSTIRAGVKLWLGFSPTKSGVFSAGNGPCMRAPLFGVMFGDNPQKLLEYVSASTRITHTDPKALSAALTVAVAAHFSGQAENVSGDEFLNRIERILTLTGENKEILEPITKAVRSAQSGETTQTFVESLGLKKGVGIYVMHTVPAVIHAWIRNPEDFKAAVLEIISCGGDTDTTAAILGAIIGARVGERGIPAAWIANIKDPYINPQFLRWLSDALVAAPPFQGQLPEPEISASGHAMRNVAFLALVLKHGFRRYLPTWRNKSQ